MRSITLSWKSIKCFRDNGCFQLFLWTNLSGDTCQTHLWILISYWFHLECLKFMKYTLCNVNSEPFMLQLSRLCSQNVGQVYEKRHWYSYILRTRQNTVSRNPVLPLLVYFNGLNYHMWTQQGLPYLLNDAWYMTFVIVNCHFWKHVRCQGFQGTFACLCSTRHFPDNIHKYFCTCNILEIIDIAQDSLRPASVCPKLCLFW